MGAERQVLSGGEGLLSKKGLTGKVGDLWAKITRREGGGLSGPGATSPDRGNSRCKSQAEVPPGGQCGWSRAARSEEERRLGGEGVGRSLGANTTVRILLWPGQHGSGVGL